MKGDRESTTDALLPDYQQQDFAKTGNAKSDTLQRNFQTHPAERRPLTTIEGR